MIAFLRMVGVLNAAIWFGASVAFTFVLGPAVFSSGMRQLLGDASFPYYAGGIATVLISRYFDLQLVCAGIAIVHAAAEWLYVSRPLNRFWLTTLGVVCGLILLGTFLAEPQIKRQHRMKYNPRATPAQRAEAARGLKIWHGGSQAANLVVLIGAGLYFWRVASSPVLPRLATPLKIGS